MRCEDVTRELAAPTGNPAPADLAGHLDSCPGCAEWARSSARFDRIWESTRPAQPPAEALDALWARAAAALDARAPATIPFEGSSRRPWAQVALRSALAASILAAAVLLPRRVDPERSSIALAPPAGPIEAEAPAPLKVTVNDLETVIVRIGDGDPRVDRHDEAHLLFPSMADNTPYDVFNAVESMAFP